MKLKDTFIEGTLIKRYKRFLADIKLNDGREITAHTPNTGAMTGCAIPGSRVWLRDTQSTTRKYPYSWEIVEAKPNVLVGIHTGLSNQLVKEAVENNIIKELQGYDEIQTEVPYGEERSRIDLLLKKTNGEECYVEVKNVTLVEDDVAYFPDAVSTRGTKHLRELMKMVKQNNRAVIFYCIQRNDASTFEAAAHIDSDYAETFHQALESGVEAYAYEAEVTVSEIKLSQAIPLTHTIQARGN